MTLLFVYNANSGKISALFDAGHKLLSPSTYQCSLCALTHDTFSENKTWKAFRTKSNLHMKFFHKDEFERHFPNTPIVYPAVLKLDKDALSMVLNDEALSKIPNVEGLIQRLKTSL